MPHFRSILVGADFSESSREAFRVACSMAHPEESRITVLHTEAPPMFRSELDVPLPLPAEDRAHCEDMERRLHEFYDPGRPYHVDYRMRDGFAADEILRAGDELDADLIVLGTHGRTGLRRLLAGSVAEAVLRKAHCTVLALRTTASPVETPAATESGQLASAKTPTVKDTSLAPTRTILFPTDFSEFSEVAFRVACRLAREENARLIVLHAAPMATVYGGTFPGVPTDPTIYQHALEARLRQIQIPGPVFRSLPLDEEADRPGAGRPARSEPAHPEILVEHRLKTGDAASEIVQVAVEVGAHLIVMATHGRNGLARVLMGSVAESVLRRAPCAVLMLKAPLTELEPVSNPARSKSVTLF